MTAGGAAKRSAWVVLAGLCPGLAAALACGAASGVTTGLLVGLATAGVGAVVALLADADRGRSLLMRACNWAVRAVSR